MKSLSVGVVLVLVVASFAGAARIVAQSTHDADVRELQRLETVWNEAHEHGDTNALEKLWADGMEVAVPKMPVMTRVQRLDARLLSFCCSRYRSSY
jgi:hypothetical protein